MIPDPTAIAERLGPAFVFMPLVLAGLLTGLVFFVQAVAGRFENRNS